MKKIDPTTKWNLFCNHRQLIHHRWILCILLFFCMHHPLQAQQNTISINYSLPEHYYYDPFDVIFSWGSSNSVMINFTGILVHIDIFYQHTSPESLTGLQVAIDTTSLSSSWAEPLQVQSTYIDETQANIPVENGGPFSIHTSSIVENPDYGLTPVFSTHTDTDPPKTNGYTAYLGSLDVYVPPDAGGRYNFKFIIDTQYSYWTSESQGENVKLPLEFESNYFNFDVVTGCCVIDYQDPFDRDPICYYLTGWWCYEYGGWATPPVLR